MNVTDDRQTDGLSCVPTLTEHSGSSKDKSRLKALMLFFLDLFVSSFTT